MASRAVCAAAFEKWADRVEADELVGVDSSVLQAVGRTRWQSAHPLIVFRSGPAGRRAVLAGGPEVADVVASVVGGDVPVEERRARAADLLAISESQVDAAMAYYAEFTEEIDAVLARRVREADEAEALWRRQRDLFRS